VDDILDIATMDSGRVRLSCRRVDLGQVVHDAFDVIHPIAGRKGIRIVPPTGDPAAVHADPDLLKQLIVNLLENAVKFTGEGGEVRVRVEPEASAVRLLVEDNGPGIPEDELDAIFERFYQVDGTDSREHGGSGLGLAICRSIVTWHDGRIWAESGPGRGATLVVSLPRLRAVSRVRAEPVEELTARRDEHRVPELIIEMIAEIVGAETVSLMLLDDDGGDLYIQAAMGLPDQAIRDVRVALGQSISGRVAESGEALLIPDIERDPRFPARAGEQYRTRSLLSVPVLLRDRTIGVINVTNRTSGEAFTEHDLRLVAMLARRVALVMQKLREYGDRRDAIGRLEEAIQGVIDARRHYYPSREGHTRLVVEVCEEMGVDPDETTRIHYASFLRDVGMVRLPEGVYRKPGRLTLQDRERIRRHPEEGARSIRPIELESGVFDMILAHHEELDGTGYPRGLAGPGIPRGARILAVIDAYDALRTGRPYKRAVGVADAVKELRAHAGSQFDGQAVDALVRVLVRRGDLKEEEAT
jgi:HD-GYP domain-containing protein (c-di-GMP phosphodiesterase class II)